MKTGWLLIRLKSDLCAGTGDGAAGMIDMDIAHDYGFPVIPAKRIKGCLLNEALELRDNGMIRTQTMEQLFGRPGAQKGGELRVYDSVLYKIPSFILAAENKDEFMTVENYGALREKAEKQGDLTENEILEVFTRTRTRTAMDEESGSVAAKTLRTMRAAKKGLVMRGRIELADTADETSEQALEMCVKALRHIGLGTTRGFGEVSCCLDGLKQEKAEAGICRIPFEPDERMELPFELKLEEPLLLQGKHGIYDDSADWIGGSAVRGALAGMYIKDFSLGEQAHEDERFRRIFLRDGVEFGCAFPKKGTDVYVPCPASVVREKHKESCRNRLLGCDPSMRVSEINSLVCIKGESIQFYEPVKENRMHHARPNERGIGHALADRVQEPSADMGQLYEYQALSKGQRFAGVWRGRAEDISSLMSCLARRGNQLHLGRSRSAEYGTVSFLPGKPQKIEVRNEGPTADRWMISLITPMVLLNQKTARAEADIHILIDLINHELDCGAELETDHMFVKYTRTDGYHNKWRLPLSQQSALDAGTVIVISTKCRMAGWKLEYKRWGEMTGGGYGMIRAVPIDDVASSYMMAAKEDAEIQNEDNGSEASVYRALLDHRNNRYTQQTECLEAINQAEAAALSVNSTTISQLIGILQNTPGHTWEEMQESLKNMKNLSKKKQIEHLMKPCEHKSPVFTETYLKMIQWRKRREKL